MKHNTTMKNVLVIIGIIAFLLAVVLISLSFQGRGVPVEKNIVNTVALDESANSDATVTFMAEGSVNGAELHRSIRITVSKDSRLIEVLGGYQYIPIKSQSYPNTPEAYKPFLTALQGAGFTKEKGNQAASNPEGQCPLGNTYFFSSTGFPNASKKLWSSSCSAGGLSSGTLGTFNGDFGTVQRLFQKQIPDYSKITSGVNLN